MNSTKNTFYKICAIGFVALAVLIAIAPNTPVQPEGYYGAQNVDTLMVGEMPAPKTI